MGVSLHAHLHRLSSKDNGPRRIQGEIYDPEWGEQIKNPRVVWWLSVGTTLGHQQRHVTPLHGREPDAEEAGGQERRELEARRRAPDQRRRADKKEADVPGPRDL